MIQGRRRAGLLFETTQTVRVLGELTGQNLQRDLPVKRRVLREIDLAHPAGTERGENLVMSERLPDHFLPVTAGRPLRRYPGGDPGKGDFVLFVRGQQR